MKKTILSFSSQRPAYLPKIVSRRLGHRNFASAAYKEDGDDTPEAQRAALLAQIGDKVKTEIQARGFKNETEINALITTALKDVNVEGLRNFDGKAVETSVRNMAAQIEKIEKRVAPAAQGKRTAILAELLEKNMDKIERAFKDKETRSVVTLNTRAAAVMTVDGAVDDSAVTEDMIESFSADAFVKKRRPNEYIFDIANRRTVAAVTEYKTWLEEGGEEGAFAEVAEGAVKPLMSKGLIRNVSKYKIVAGKRVYNEEFAKFRKEAMNIIEDLFNDQILRNYAAILTADLIAKAAAYVGTSLDGKYVKPTDFHAIGAVAAQIETLDFFPDLLIINPQDKWRISLSQNDEGTFFMAIPMYNPSGEVQMMGFKVFTSNRCDVGTAILGESKLFKIEDEPVQVRLGYGINVTTGGDGKVTAVESDVDHNRFRIIAETFFHDYIATNHTGSFVKFNFADVKAALLGEAV